MLPIYLTAVLGLSPLAYGFIDGLYQGVSALVRILGGWLADRADRPKWVAFLGYGLSAVTKVALIAAQGLGAVTAVITVDRLGKGLRTAPRDALIAASTPAASLGRAFGVHRALDTAGAAIGPLLAFGILWFVPGDYPAVFIASLAAAVMGLAVLLLLVPDLRPRRDAGVLAAATPLSPPSLRLLGQRRFGRLMLAAGLLGLLTISDGFLYLSLTRRDDLAATWFPLLYVGTNVAYLALAIPLGRLADRFGRARVLVAGHLLLDRRLPLRRRTGGGPGRHRALPAVPRRLLCRDRRGARGADLDPGAHRGARERHRHRPDRRGGGALRLLRRLRLALAVAGQGHRGVCRGGSSRARRPGGVVAAAQRRAPGSRAGGAGVSTRARVAALVAVCLVAVAATAAYLLASRDTQQRALREAPAQATVSVAAVQEGPRIVFRNTAIGPNYGRVAMVPLDDPGSARALTDLSCDRVFATTTRTLCLASDRGVVTTYTARVLTRGEAAPRDLPLTGIPSRARLSRDGSRAATTSFVSGDSYATTGFSTRTVVTALDGSSADLETFRLVHRGKAIAPVDRNYWGVTFAADGDTFYATASFGGRNWLSRGSLSRRTLTTLRSDAECPSLSPDGSQGRVQEAPGPRSRRLADRRPRPRLRQGDDAGRGPQCRRPGRVARRPPRDLRPPRRGRRRGRDQRVGRAGRRHRGPCAAHREGLVARRGALTRGVRADRLRPCRVR